MTNLGWENIQNFTYFIITWWVLFYLKECAIIFILVLVAGKLLGNNSFKNKIAFSPPDVNKNFQLLLERSHWRHPSFLPDPLVFNVCKTVGHLFHSPYFSWSLFFIQSSKFFYFITRFCCESTVMLVSSFFCICNQDLWVFNVKCCWRCINSFYVSKIFLPLCNPVVLSVVHTFLINGKTGFKNILKSIQKWVKTYCWYHCLFKQIPVFCIFEAQKFMFHKLQGIMAR